LGVPNPLERSSNILKCQNGATSLPKNEFLRDFKDNFASTSNFGSTECAYIRYIEDFTFFCLLTAISTICLSNGCIKLIYEEGRLYIKKPMQQYIAYLLAIPRTAPISNPSDGSALTARSSSFVSLATYYMTSHITTL
jgi:hypothetical protein